MFYQLLSSQKLLFQIHLLTGGYSQGHVFVRKSEPEPPVWLTGILVWNMRSANNTSQAAASTRLQGGEHTPLNPQEGHVYAGQRPHISGRKVIPRDIPC